MAIGPTGTNVASANPRASKWPHPQQRQQPINGGRAKHPPTVRSIRAID
jgi:hypothetical protein